MAIVSTVTSLFAFAAQMPQPGVKWTPGAARTHPLGAFAAVEVGAVPVPFLRARWRRAAWGRWGRGRRGTLSFLARTCVGPHRGCVPVNESRQTRTCPRKQGRVVQLVPPKLAIRHDGRVRIRPLVGATEWLCQPAEMLAPSAYVGLINQRPGRGPYLLWYLSIMS